MRETAYPIPWHYYDLLDLLSVASMIHLYQPRCYQQIALFKENMDIEALQSYCMVAINYIVGISSRWSPLIGGFHFAPLYCGVGWNKMLEGKRGYNHGFTWTFFYLHAFAKGDAASLKVAFHGIVLWCHIYRNSMVVTKNWHPVPTRLQSAIEFHQRASTELSALWNNVKTYTMMNNSYTVREETLT